MSRSYEITIGVSGFDRMKADAITEAIKGLEYETEEGYSCDEPGNTRLDFRPETININAGRTEDEVAQELHHAIWKANEAFCIVTVGLRYLDDTIPFVGDEAGYDEWIGNEGEGPFQPA